MFEFKILSIDGGGIRGIIPCTILAFIEDQIGTLSSNFHLMAGTSTGGIITMGLATPNLQGGNAFSARDMLDMYVKHGNEIFAKRQVDAKNWLANWVTNVFNNPYKSEGLENLLKEKFGNAKLSDSLTELLITTYEIEKGKPYYFQSRLAKLRDEDNFDMIEIARSTSAAPTYFDPATIKNAQNEQLAFIDGGVFANNPSILAYSEAKELWKRMHGLGFDPEVAPDDNDLPFFMLSLGTGRSPISLAVEDAKNFRSINWAKPLINILMDGVSESTDFTMHHLLPKKQNGTPRYKRLNLVLSEENSAMDDVSPKNIQALQDMANRFVEKNENTLLQICDILNA